MCIRDRYLAVFLVTLITFSIASSSYYSLSFFGAVTFFFIPMAVEIMAIAWACLLYTSRCV